MSAIAAPPLRRGQPGPPSIGFGGLWIGPGRRTTLRKVNVKAQVASNPSSPSGRVGSFQSLHAEVLLLPERVVREVD